MYMHRYDLPKSTAMYFRLFAVLDLPFVDRCYCDYIWEDYSQVMNQCALKPLIFELNPYVIGNPR